jgi:hypothetical protein
MLLWSAASGFLVGLMIGVLVLAFVTLAVHVVPGISERIVARLRMPVLVLLLLLVPVIGGLLGYLEGRTKLS